MKLPVVIALAALQVVPTSGADPFAFFQPTLAVSSDDRRRLESGEAVAHTATVSVTHVSILRGQSRDLPDALVAGKQIFATHYVNAARAITAIVKDQTTGRRYLAYLNRSAVDALGGPFGGLVKSIVERRLKNEAMRVLLDLRTRLGSGDPPAPAISRHAR